ALPVHSMKIIAALASLAFAAAAAEPLADKTFVAWVAPANLEQRGGGVLGLEDSQGRFDSLVFGELAPARWMAGSEMFRRTDRAQDAWAAETEKGPVQIAVVYRGKDVAIFRNAKEY